MMYRTFKQSGTKVAVQFKTASIVYSVLKLFILLTTMVDTQFRSLTDTLVKVTILLTHVIMALQMCNKLLAMATYKTVVLHLHHSLFVYSEHCSHYGLTHYWLPYF
jgi:hypothetical protein